MIVWKDILKIPNLLSLSRILLMIPFVYFFMQKDLWITFVLIVIIILTDFLDGFTSRKLKQETELGKIIDPLADKICLGVGLILILYHSGVTLIPIFVLILRDIVIIILGLKISLRLKTMPASNIYGKLTSFFLSFTGLWFFLSHWESFFLYLAYIFYGLGSLFIVLSSISYGMRAYQLLKK